MAQRLLEIIVPEARRSGVEDALDGRAVLGRWLEADGGGLLIQALVEVEETQAVLDRLEQQFEGRGDLRVAVLAVEASVPTPTAQAPQEDAHASETEEKRHQRVGREELYQAITDGAKTSPVFIAMTVLSAVVATVGLLRNDLAAVIGAMVIAPMLSPNVALALATTLGDLRLALWALRANAIGILVVVVFSFALGKVLTVDPTTPQIAARTTVGLTDIALALAAGAAGTLAFTSGLPSTLVGVMVAVALLPPTATFGLLAGSHHAGLAARAGLLLVTNIICINLAGVTTFLFQGVRPRTWWESERAKRATRIALIVWTLLLLLLAVVLLLARPDRG